MTDAEFQKVMQEAAEHVRRTSFPPADPRDEYEAHGHHAESQAYRHG